MPERARWGSRLSDNANPWVIGDPGAEPVQAPTPPPMPTTRREVLRGPVAPQPSAVAVPERADRLPQRTVHGGAALWWTGAHGGAGESTLATLAAGTRAGEHAWPVSGDRGGSSRVAIVARTNYAGLMAAQRIGREWASGAVPQSVELVGLIVVADAPGRRPKELRQLEQHVAGGFPRLWTLPWVEAWRLAEPSAATMPREYRQVLADLNLTQTTNH